MLSIPCGFHPYLLWACTFLLVLFVSHCHGSLVLAAICFVFPATSGGNLLPVLAKKGVPMVLTKISTYAFALIMLLPSIPVSFIVSNNNLVQNDVVPKRKFNHF
jgi:hypothetical protein